MSQHPVNLFSFSFISSIFSSDFLLYFRENSEKDSQSRWRGFHEERERRGDSASGLNGALSTIAHSNARRQCWENVFHLIRDSILFYLFVFGLFSIYSKIQVNIKIQVNHGHPEIIDKRMKKNEKIPRRTGLKKVSNSFQSKQ